MRGHARDSLDEGAWGGIGAIALICLPTAWYVLRPRKPIASHVHVGYLCRRLFALIATF